MVENKPNIIIESTKRQLTEKELDEEVNKSNNLEKSPIIKIMRRVVFEYLHIYFKPKERLKAKECWNV